MRHFGYPISSRLFQGIMVCTCLLVLLVSLTSFAVASPTDAPPANFIARIQVTVGALLGLIVVLNWDPPIRVVDEGIHVKVFSFWWRFIPWSEVSEFRDTVWPRSRVRVVISRGLTPAHRLIGLFAFTTEPAFFIRRQIEDFDELLAIIRRNVEKHRNQKKAVA